MIESLILLISALISASNSAKFRCVEPKGLAGSPLVVEEAADLDEWLGLEDSFQKNQRDHTLRICGATKGCGTQSNCLPVLGHNATPFYRLGKFQKLPVRIKHAPTRFLLEAWNDGLEAGEFARSLGSIQILSQTTDGHYRAEFGAILLSEQSQVQIVSDSLLVVASFRWGKDETRYAPHHFWIRAWNLNQPLAPETPAIAYQTKSRYRSFDDVDTLDVISHEHKVVIKAFAKTAKLAEQRSRLSRLHARFDSKVKSLPEAIQFPSGLDSLLLAIEASPSKWKGTEVDSLLPEEVHREWIDSTKQNILHTLNCFAEDDSSRNHFVASYLKKGRDSSFRNQLHAFLKDSTRTPFSSPCSDRSAKRHFKTYPFINNWFLIPYEQFGVSHLSSPDLIHAYDVQFDGRSGRLASRLDTRDFQSQDSIYNQLLDSLLQYSIDQVSNNSDTASFNPILSELAVWMAMVYSKRDHYPQSAKFMDISFAMRSKMPETLRKHFSRLDENNDFIFRAYLFEKCGELDSAIQLLLPIYDQSINTQLMRMLRLRYSQKEIADSFDFALENIDWRKDATLSPTTRYRANSIYEYHRIKQYPGVVQLFGVNIGLNDHGVGDILHPSRESLLYGFKFSDFYQILYCGTGEKKTDGPNAD
ncbi:MAG: hypothetical protein IPN71_01335 [Fibrobacteres bacterium]|nr:hypothetical protein [Fibrobacterota bacterium]